MTNLNDWAKDAYENAKNKGFYDKEVNIGERLALIHSEVSEALEEIRSGRNPTEVYFEEKADGSKKPAGYVIELCDVLIRTLDEMGRLGVDVDKLMHLKQDYNKSRPKLHGKSF